MSLASAVMKRALTVAVEAAEVAAQAFKTRNVGGLLEVVEVEGGAFAMGSGRSARWVGLTDYFMGRTAVTEGQWRKLVAVGEDMEKARFAAMRKFGLDPARINPSHPAVCTSWSDAEEFVRRLNGTTEARGSGLSFLLPTEAQQEFSIKGRMLELRQLAGKEGADFSTEAAVRRFLDDRFENLVVVPPDVLPEIGSVILTVDDAIPLILRGQNRVFASRVFGTQSGRLTTEEEAWFSQRGLAAADWGPLNPQGLKGRPGGAWEWGTDWYGDIARSRFSIDPLGPETGQFKMMRGGSWGLRDPGRLWAARRFNTHPDGRGVPVGFRVAAAL